MILRIFKFKWRTLRFLFQKRPSCSEGKARVRLFKSYDCSYKGKHEIRRIRFELLYKWKCNCKRGDRLPYCEGLGNVICFPEQDRLKRINIRMNKNEK